MNGYDWDWSVVLDAGPQILQGLLVTLELTVVVIAASMLLAVPVAFLRMSSIDIVRWLAQAYIEVFRCTPVLVQLFWIFYALPALTGITLPGFASAFIALTANMTAFMAETYRSGFQSVPVEQVEAAKMLRLSRLQQIRYVILPQALRQQLPVILSLNISMFKETALVSTIAVSDLMYVSNVLAAQSYRSLEVLTAAAAVYFVIAFPASVITSNIERKMMAQGPTSKTGPSILTRMLPGTRVKVAA